MILFTAPKNFTVNYIPEFLAKVERTFFWKDRLIPNVKFDLSTIRNIDILGLLIIYKYIDFTYTNYCFKKPNLLVDEYITESWNKYEFDSLFQAYISNKEVSERAFKGFKIKLEERFIIAPQALLRTTNYTNEYLKKEFIPNIEKYYAKSPESVSLIFSCFSEILLNFWEHAIQDTKSVILADGNKNKIEIACADTGVGIISNLTPMFSKNMKPEDVLEKAIQKGVTSKPNSNHMGFGLWIVSQLVNANRGRMHLYSQGYYFYNDFGKIRKGKCAYWPGTVVYLNLNLDNPKTISEVINNENFNNLKINFT